MRRQKSRQDRWFCIFGVGFLATFISFLVLRAGQRVSQAKSAVSANSIRLKFHPNRQQTEETSSPASFTFKIMQIADIHLGENAWTDWGPEQDVKTFHVLDSVIVAERPDLIVLSGDQLTANNVDKNATAYYQLLGEQLSYYGVPWAVIFGNHDDAPLEKDLPNGTISKTPAKASREQLLAVDKKFPLSLSQCSNGMFGSSNYVLNIHYPSAYSKRRDDVAFQLFFLDSGGGSLKMQLEQSQIDWFLKAHRPDLLGAAVFQHIPTTDFVYKDGMCSGLHDNDVYAVDYDPGIVQTLHNSGNVKWLGVGHIHGSDFCCATNGGSDLHLCFGRHSGYGGYGNWDRGARIYELQLSIDHTSSEKESLEWRSYVRMEDRTIIDRYDPTPT